MKMFILFIFFVIAYIVTIKIVFRQLNKVKKSVTLKYFKSVLEVIGVFILIAIYLRQFDGTKDLSKVLLTGGSLLIALVTFSAQKVLGNIISGFVISVVKPFEIGEKVSLLSSGGNSILEGFVIDINLRHVTIKQVDGRCCLVPNHVLDECVVVNSDTLENHGYPLPMWCTFDSDVEKAIELMHKEIENNPLTINTDKSVVLCSEIGEDGFKLQAIIWTENVADSFTACSQLRLSIYKAWHNAGINVPYKTITISNDE